jgi:hypothetical protein
MPWSSSASHEAIQGDCSSVGAATLCDHAVTSWTPILPRMNVCGRGSSRRDLCLRPIVLALRRIVSGRCIRQSHHPSVLCSNSTYCSSFSMRSTCVINMRRQQYRFAPTISMASLCTHGRQHNSASFLCLFRIIVPTRRPCHPPTTSCIVARCLRSPAPYQFLKPRN